MQPVIIFGVGKIAEVAYSYLRYASSENFMPIAFTCDAEYMPPERTFLGLPVVPFERESLEAFWVTNWNVPASILLPIGYKDCNSARAEKFEQARSWGLNCISYVHPSNTMWPNLVIGANAFILETNVIQPAVTIGDNVTIWSQCHIGHHCEIGNHVWITSGATICSSVKIGDYAFIGAGAVLRDNIEIAPKTVIGMGAIITKSTKPGQVFLSGPNNLFKRSSEAIKL
jgi:sugar O-acyltransferase (sialic acid O-acetyltransferase NeuD family)